MRVVAGLYRSRQLTAPPGLDTRPILDRVKVGVFDWIGSRLAEPGRLPAINVLDIFCGGGSLGIECLSRGAEFCQFVESGPLAVRCLRDNLSMLDIGEAARVVVGDAGRIRISPPPSGAYGLIFLDPPYRLNADLGADGLMTRLTRRLSGEIAVEDDALLLWRHETSQSLPETLHEFWRCEQRRVWGDMAVTLYARCPGATG